MTKWGQKLLLWNEYQWNYTCCIKLDLAVEAKDQTEHFKWSGWRKGSHGNAAPGTLHLVPAACVPYSVGTATGPAHPVELVHRLHSDVVLWCHLISIYQHPYDKWVQSSCFRGRWHTPPHPEAASIWSAAKGLAIISGGAQNGLHGGSLPQAAES